jgi:hypothetical protein
MTSPVEINVHIRYSPIRRPPKAPGNPEWRTSTRKDFPWTNSHHIAGDLRAGVQKLKDATPAGVLLGSGKLATELDRLDQIEEYNVCSAKCFCTSRKLEKKY